MSLAPWVPPPPPPWVIGEKRLPPLVPNEKRAEAADKVAGVVGLEIAGEEAPSDREIALRFPDWPEMMRQRTAAVQSGVVPPSRALDTLPTRARAVFDWHRFRSMAYREIADDLDIDAEEVERRIAQAMAHLSSDADKPIPGGSERIWAWLHAALRRVWPG